MKRGSRSGAAPRARRIAKSRRGRKRPSSRSRCGLKSSAAAHVVVAAAFDRAPRDRAADRAEHGAERLRIARCDDVAEHPAGDAARTEERRVGKECVSPCRYRRSPSTAKKKQQKKPKKR